MDLVAELTGQMTKWRSLCVRVAPVDNISTWKFMQKTREFRGMGDGQSGHSVEACQLTQGVERDCASNVGSDCNLIVSVERSVIGCFQ